MMNIAAALGGGYTTKQILNFIAQQYPQFSDRIQEASKMGYSPEEIVKLIGKQGKKTFERMSGSRQESDRTNRPFPEESSSNPLIRGAQAGEKRSTENREYEKDLFQKGIMGFAGATGGLLASKALSRLPQAAQSFARGISPTQTQTSPTQTQISTKAQEAISPNSIPPSGNGLSENIVEQSLSPEESSDILDKMGFSSTVKAMSKTSSPEEIAAVLEQHMMTPGQKKWFQSTGKGSLQDVVSQSIKNMGDQGPKSKPNIQQEAEQNLETPGIDQTLNPPLAEMPSEPDITKPEIQKQEEKTKKVMLPDGRIGSVVSEKSGIFKIDDDGKTSHRKADEVLEAPLPTRDLADIYEELVGAIPEKERSAVINWAGYDPNVNELAFRPHSGSLYVYKDIPEEFANKLKNSMFQAKTTGSNFYGEWEEGKESRFAGLHKLIRELQDLYGGKGKEYSRKYETLVDFLGAPEKAKKEKKQREAQEKRDAKKRQKPNR